METILLTTTEGHERLERARDRFAQAAKEPEDEDLQRKRRRTEGEGRQPLAPPREVGGSCSGSALPLAPPPAPPPLERSPLAKRSFGTGNRNDRGNRRTTGGVKEAKGASGSTSSRGQQ